MLQPRRQRVRWGRGKCTGVREESEKRSRNSIVASGCLVKEEEWQGNNGTYLTLVTGFELGERTTKDTIRCLITSLTLSVMTG